MHIDDDLIDERLKQAMELRKERKSLGRKIEKMDESYRARRKPHDERIDQIDVELASLVTVQPVAPAGPTGPVAVEPK